MTSTNNGTTPRGPVDSSRIPRYAGPATFARLPRLDEVGTADVAVIGVPFDSGVSYRPGARFGGNAIREASRLLRPYNPAQDASPFALAQVADGGDIAVNPFNIDEAVETVEAAADDLLGTGARLMTLGGDHTIALPLLRSVAKKHGPVALLHFDAHLDTWDTYFGAEYTHGTPFRRAVEDGQRVLAGHSEDGGRAEPGERLHDQVPAVAAGRRVQRRLGLRGGGAEHQVVVVGHRVRAFAICRDMMVVSS
jgi:agmatinase